MIDRFELGSHFGKIGCMFSHLYSLTISRFHASLEVATFLGRELMGYKRECEDDRDKCVSACHCLYACVGDRESKTIFHCSQGLTTSNGYIGGGDKGA